VVIVQKFESLREAELNFAFNFVSFRRKRKEKIL